LSPAWDQTSAANAGGNGLEREGAAEQVQKPDSVSSFTVIVSLGLGLLLTLITTPNIWDYQIPWDVKAWVLRLGLTSVLIFMALSTLARLRRSQGDQPPKLS
jgi:hypothetical protein